MDDEYESPFLDRDMPWFASEQESAEPVSEFDSPFREGFVQEGSPFLSGETENEFELDGEFEADPSLFDPADLAREFESSDTEWNAESWTSNASVSDELRTFEDPDSASESFWRAPQESEDEDIAQGETVFLSGEGGWAEEQEGVDGEVVFLSESETWNELEDESSPATTPVLGRILWPALGFPAVIAPQSGSNTPAGAGSNATNCITVLLLTNRKNLSKAEAAQYLRIVPWKDRGRRHIKSGEPGSFREVDLAVRNDETRSMTIKPAGLNAKREQYLMFGGDADGKLACEALLSAKVRQLYAEYGLKYLHEIRVSEEVCAKLPASVEPYHIFWNNQSTNENAPSDEMALLLQKFAKPRRQAEGAQWQKVLPQLMLEYEYEYGTMHLPHTRKPTKRAEILHPVFVRASNPQKLRIGHLTDLHVDVRNDVYEYNLAKQADKQKVLPQFNNWNVSAARSYAGAKSGSDIVLMTGDLIDYGRGHFGISANQKLGDNTYYHRDRNWFLFYDILAAGDRYSRPTYTSLGNHDWRLNPYPPFAIAGTPSTNSYFHNYSKYDDKDRKSLIVAAHGPGSDESISYDPRWQTLGVADIVKKLPVLIKGSVSLDEPGLPTYTDIDSVLWYLLSINPFLDYAWSLPGNFRFLSLDWAQDETVLFPIVKLGKAFAEKTSKADFDTASDPGPKAKSSLSPTQTALVKSLVENPSKAKVFAIHAPIIGPYGDWSDMDLARGIKTYKNRSVARGPMNYGERKNGKVTPYHGHPLFAIAPPGDMKGMVADYCSIQKNREWLVKTLADQKSGVRLLFSGHIHRNSLLAVRIGTKADGVTNGQYLVASVQPTDVAGYNGPAIAPKRGAFRAPLYVNTTTAGLRGNYNPSEEEGKQSATPGYAIAELGANGTILSVDFRDAALPAMGKGAPPVLREAAGVGGWS